MDVIDILVLSTLTKHGRHEDTGTFTSTEHGRHGDTATVNITMDVMEILLLSTFTWTS